MSQSSSATPSSITTYFESFFVISAGFRCDINTLTRPIWSSGDNLRVIIAPEGTATAKRMCDARVDVWHTRFGL